MNTPLHKKVCEPCQGGIPPLSKQAIGPLLRQLNLDWSVVDNHHLTRTFKFKNFVEALAFVNKIGRLAESAGHHPNISFTWGIVEVCIWTHKIDGLHASDFILAAKIDHLVV